jgi:hypothetical protein
VSLTDGAAPLAVRLKEAICCASGIVARFANTHRGYAPYEVMQWRAWTRTLRACVRACVHACTRACVSSECLRRRRVRAHASLLRVRMDVSLVVGVMCVSKAVAFSKKRIDRSKQASIRERLDQLRYARRAGAIGARARSFSLVNSGNPGTFRESKRS